MLNIAFLSLMLLLDATVMSTANMVCEIWLLQLKASMWVLLNSKQEVEFELKLEQIFGTRVEIEAICKCRSAVLLQLL